MVSVFEVFVQNPAAIGLVAGTFFLFYLLLRGVTRVTHPRALLWPSIAWALWAIWEFVIVRFSPDADIRVDLLIILPVVLILSVAGFVRAIWPQRA